MSNASPVIHRLPPEILVKIFRHLRATEDRFEWDPSQNDNATLKRSIVPYSISSVCRYWDEASTLAPELWGHNCVLVSLDNHEGGSPAQMVERYLQCAPHDHHLVVQVICGDDQRGDKEGAKERRGIIAFLSILWTHLDRISELFIHTRFATSLPPFSLLGPLSTSSTLKTLTVNTDGCKAPQDVLLPPWPMVPSIQLVPQLVKLDLVGQTFISYCRAINCLRHPPEHHPGQDLTVRNLSHNSADPLSLEELLEFLTRNAHYLTKLTIEDVDLCPLHPAFTLTHEVPVANQDSTQPTTPVDLTRLGEETLAGILWACHRVFRLGQLLLSECSIQSPIKIPLMQIDTVIFKLLNVSSIINALRAINPTNVLHLNSNHLGDGVELFQQLETVRREQDGSHLLDNTMILVFHKHGYISLDALCHFVETGWKRSRSDVSSNFLPAGLHINPMLPDWTRMKDTLAYRRVTQLADREVGGEHFNMSVNEVASLSFALPVLVAFTPIG
ncbi:hypothetical protein BKA70DRAFT_1336358 [Coprinopsis sp. MPI-PUGE-AT-0042]|nr:hypothetical protein BKA70DRAFT_1336358 [Coprinopsis sp. MPI-PUGE-AT-0042]